MASNINTSNIDATFPVQGKDNPSQGFRDNFSYINIALDTAASEITALQANPVGVTIATTTATGVVKIGNGVSVALDGTISVSSTATNIAGGLQGDIPIQTASGKTSFIAPGTSGSVLVMGTTTATWQTSLSLGNNLYAGGTIISANPIVSSSNIGAFSYGTLGYSDINIVASYASTSTTYNQMVLQNNSTSSTASTNFNVSNNQATPSTFFGEFGINSPNFSGVGSFSQSNNVYLAAASSDLVIGTYSSNAVRVNINNSSTDAMVISNSGTVTIASNLYVNGAAVTTASGWLTYVPTISGESATGFTVTNATFVYNKLSSNTVHFRLQFSAAAFTSTGGILVSVPIAPQGTPAFSGVNTSTSYMVNALWNGTNLRVMKYDGTTPLSNSSQNFSITGSYQY